jgi:hypothetical protein
MAVISETIVCLRFFGDDLNPDGLTMRLGSAPTASVTKGQTIIAKTTGFTRIAKTGSWRFEVERREPGDLETQIREVFGALTDDLTVWRDLSKYEPDLFVGLFMKEGNEGIDISTEALGLLSSRGVSIDLDIYGPTQDD